MSVRIQQLVREFQEGSKRLRVIDHLDLDIATGERLALLGRSGSGKSTLLNLLAGIDRPDGGKIFIDESLLTDRSERERTLFRRRHIGFIYQFFNLLPTLSVMENIALPLELNGANSGEVSLRASEMLERVGLGDRAGAFPDRLSGGEQQRVAIARALVHRPQLVLADEPTGNLDAQTGSQILQLLNELATTLEQTLLLVTHSREVALSADRTVILSQGMIEPASPTLAW